MDFPAGGFPARTGVSFGTCGWPLTRWYFFGMAAFPTAARQAPARLRRPFKIVPDFQARTRQRNGIEV